MVRVSGMGAPNATSSHGQSMMEKPGMNTDTEGPNTVEVQQGEQRVAETNVDDVSVSGMVFPTKGALSNVLGNEEAFQTHLKEIDMELEGLNDKVLHEGGAECDEVRQMVEESNVVETNSGVLEPPVQHDINVSKAGFQLNKLDGCQSIHTCWEKQDRDVTETVSMELGQPNSDLGPKTRTWKRLQIQAKSVSTVGSKEVEVGTKRKHKEKINLNECSESPELKKRKEDDEVLVVSDLLQNEFGSAVAARQHRRKQ